MGFLDSILAADAANVFCNANDFAEPVTYTQNPTGSASSSKTINAVVYRLPPQEMHGATGVAAPVVEVEIPNDPTYGVTAINRNGDTLTVADRQGGTPTVHQINEIVSQDAGMWRLRLR